MAGLRKNLMPLLKKNFAGCPGIELETPRTEIYVTIFRPQLGRQHLY